MTIENRKVQSRVVHPLDLFRFHDLAMSSIKSKNFSIPESRLKTHEPPMNYWVRISSIMVITKIVHKMYVLSALSNFIWNEFQELCNIILEIRSYDTLWLQLTVRELTLIRITILRYIFLNQEKQKGLVINYSRVVLHFISYHANTLNNTPKIQSMTRVQKIYFILK